MIIDKLYAFCVFAFPLSDCWICAVACSKSHLGFIEGAQALRVHLSFTNCAAGEIGVGTFLSYPSRHQWSYFFLSMPSLHVMLNWRHLLLVIWPASQPDGSVFHPKSRPLMLPVKSLRDAMTLTARVLFGNYQAWQIGHFDHGCNGIGIWIAVRCLCPSLMSASLLLWELFLLWLALRNAA